jgi:hypothetical protein
MEIHEIASNLLAGKTCQTCGCVERVAHKFNTCKFWRQFEVDVFIPCPDSGYILRPGYTMPTLKEWL